MTLKPQLEQELNESEYIEYISLLEKTRELIHAKKLDSVIALLKNIEVNTIEKILFPTIKICENFKDLKIKLKQLVDGVNSDNSDNLCGLYEEAVHLLGSSIGLTYAFVIAHLKLGHYKHALDLLQDTSGPEDSAFKAISLAGLKCFEEACEEIAKYKGTSFKSHLDSVANYAQHARAESMRDIQKEVELENFETALKLSYQFLHSFPSYELIAANLENHIKPMVLLPLWKENNVESFYDNAYKIWKLDNSFVNLHNLGISLFDYSLKDKSSLPSLIWVWGSILLNLEKIPSIYSPFWGSCEKNDLLSLTTKTFDEIELHLQSAYSLESEEYLQLRDLLKIEVRIVEAHNNLQFKPPIRNNFVIGPGLFILNWRKELTMLPSNDWTSMYTPYARCISAWKDGNQQRALKMMPKSPGKNNVELYAARLNSFYLALYYLENGDMDKSRKQLGLCADLIKREDLKYDIASNAGRRDLLNKEFMKYMSSEDGFEAMQLWHDVMQTKEAASALATVKAQRIRDQLLNKKISPENALAELKQLKILDVNNSLIIDVEDIVYAFKEDKIVQDLLHRENYEELARRARSFQSKKVRYRVARMFHEVAINAVSDKPPPFQLIYDFAHKSYLICPNEPQFQPLFSAFKFFQ
jgi:hypothetical protein